MNVRIVKGKLVLPIAVGCKNLTKSKYVVVLDNSRFNYALEVFDKMPKRRKVDFYWDALVSN